MQQQTLTVLPNKYTFIDEDGEPQGACPADPTHAAGKRMWIGARLDQARTKIDTAGDKAMRGLVAGQKRWAGDARPSPQTTKFVFVKAPVTIPQTPHYLDCIRCGDLIPADQRTHEKVFGRSVPFVPPDQRIKDERAKAAALYEAQHMTTAPFLGDAS